MNFICSLLLPIILNVLNIIPIRWYTDFLDFHNGSNNISNIFPNFMNQCLCDISHAITVLHVNNVTIQIHKVILDRIDLHKKNALSLENYFLLKTLPGGLMLILKYYYMLSIFFLKNNSKKLLRLEFY